MSFIINGELKRESLYSVIMSMAFIHFIQVKKSFVENRSKKWKHFDQFSNPPPFIDLPASVAVDPRISTPGDFVENAIIDLPGGGDCKLLSAALCDLKVLGLDMDVVAKRQLFGLRSVKREFPDREITFQPDGTLTIHAEAIAK